MLTVLPILLFDMIILFLFYLMQKITEGLHQFQLY